MHASKPVPTQALGSLSEQPMQLPPPVNVWHEFACTSVGPEHRFSVMVVGVVI